LERNIASWMRARRPKAERQAGPKRTHVFG
jgi:hypothetical protein